MSIDGNLGSEGFGQNQHVTDNGRIGTEKNKLIFKNNEMQEKPQNTEKIINPT